MSMSMWREDGESNKRSVIIVIYGAGRCYLGRRKEVLFTSSLMVILAVVRRMISFTTAPGEKRGVVEDSC